MIEETNRSKPLEPFLLLAKTARGAAAAHLIQNACESPNVFVFGELLQVDGIKELKNNAEYSKAWKLLQLYAFGVYPDYIKCPTEYPELNENHLKKLRLLTIATLASKTKYVPYVLLQESLSLDNLREIEDLVIEAIYADLLKGKLNQKKQRLEVDFVIGRDLKPENIDTIINTLESWCANCERVMEGLETQSVRANCFKDTKINKQKLVDNEVENIKKTLKDVVNSQDVDVDTTVQQQQRILHKMKTMKASIKPSSSRTR